MKNKHFYLLFTLILFACQDQNANQQMPTFKEDLLELKDYFHIPGLAAIVTKNGRVIFEDYLGYRDLENRVALDSNTLFPIASITKTFAATALMKLVEGGKIDLEAPINRYLRTSDHFPESVTVRHVLSHTSEGQPGSFFNYSPRFFRLTEVLEKTSGLPFEQLLRDSILFPLSLENTIGLTNQSRLDSLLPRLAKPYSFYGETEPGHYDFGLSTSSGLVSNVRDLAAFDRALSTDGLLSQSGRQQMFTATAVSTGNSPYGLGIFVQEFNGKKMVWGYGQEDCFSSLLLKVPEDGLSLILLANNNLMSDPARLINGDVTYSLFALRFLQHFVFDNKEIPEFNRQEMLAKALASGFMGFGDSTEWDKSRQLTKTTLERFPEFTRYGNQSTLRLLNILSTAANLREFDPVMVELGEVLLSRYEFDPYTNIYLAGYHQAREDHQSALHYYQKILEPKNTQPFWYTIEALDFLGDHYKDRSPDQARACFQRIVDIGWNISGKLDKAKKELQELTPD